MIRILVTIFVSFFKIGICTIGGGLVIIPLIQAEMLSRGWLTTPQFLDILGIAQATPGPIGVNTATFVGYRVFETQGYSVWAALLGALVATLSVSAPSVVCVHFGGSWFERNREKGWMKTFFRWLRPVVAFIVTWAGVRLSWECIQGITGGNVTVLIALCVMLVSAAMTMSRRFSPLWALAIGAVIGAFSV